MYFCVTNEYVLINIQAERFFLLSFIANHVKVFEPVLYDEWLGSIDVALFPNER